MTSSDIRSRMLQAVSMVQTDIGGIRTGRATPGLVESIVVSAYGGAQKLKIQELATITTSDTQTIVIDPWDKSIIGDIKAGILSANVGLNPSVDGEVIRISLPPLTTEDREKFVKLLSSKLESGKVIIRQIRGDEMRAIKEAYEKKEITEDEKFTQEKELQGITDEHIEKIEGIGELKKQELLQV